MMDRTDRHFRYLMRRITKRTLLYTEMVTAQAILRGRSERYLAFHPDEHPIAVQLGGDDPASLIAAARIAEDMGYDEVNLNCGCPSDRVQSGRFGAILMAHPHVVADAVSALRGALRIPVTVKHRIGIDDRDRYEDMLDFVDTVAAAGAQRFTVHARKAWLQGLSPKENRSIPPLRYADVRRLKLERPHLAIELNGGVMSLEAVREHLGVVDAVMIGRAAYDDPLIFDCADAEVFGASARPARSREDVVGEMIPYLERVEAEGVRPHAVLRHMMGLFSGRRGGRAWRRVLSREGPRAHRGGPVLRHALEAMAAAGQTQGGATTM